MRSLLFTVLLVCTLLVATQAARICVFGTTDCTGSSNCANVADDACNGDGGSGSQRITRNGDTFTYEQWASSDSCSGTPDSSRTSDAGACVDLGSFGYTISSASAVTPALTVLALVATILFAA